MAINWLMLTCNLLFQHAQMQQQWNTCCGQVLDVLTTLAQAWSDVTTEELWNLSQPAELDRALQLLEDGLSLFEWQASLKWNLPEPVKDALTTQVTGLVGERLDHVANAWIARSLRHLDAAISMLDAEWDNDADKNDTSDIIQATDRLAGLFFRELQLALDTLLRHRGRFAAPQLSSEAWRALQAHVMLALSSACVAQVGSLNGVRQAGLLGKLYAGLIEAVYGAETREQPSNGYVYTLVPMSDVCSS
jgi:hypothetical protein